jgi:hypothetical protein
MFELGEYILYEMNSHTMVDRSKQEIDIINTIGEFYNENLNYRFSVVYYDPVTTEPISRRIRNIGDYELYIQEYNQKIKNEPIMQLKKEMFDIIDKPKIKNLHKK